MKMKSRAGTIVPTFFQSIFESQAVSYVQNKMKMISSFLSLLEINLIINTNSASNAIQ
jgi:hypothetical protein